MSKDSIYSPFARLGGLAVKKKYGIKHFKEMARKSAEVRSKKRKLVQSDIKDPIDTPNG